MDELDIALERFHLCAPEYGAGFSSHGPMAAEALLALGHPSLIPALVDIYAPRLPELADGQIIDADTRGAALGDPRRAPDWIATFEADLAARGADAVLAEWLRSLLPGAFGAAGHGLIRTAQALRAWSAAPSDPRLRELAHGLGYWAATFQPLPGQPGRRPTAGRTPDRVLAELEFTTEREPSATLISEAVRALDRSEHFAEAVEAVDLDAQPPGEALGETARTAAALYLAHPELRILYAHAITIPSAMRLLLPHLEPDLARLGAGYALQCTAAIHAVYGQRRAGSGNGAPTDDAEVIELAEHLPEIRYRAACSVEEHAIKLAEACLREHTIAPDPVLPLAAADAAIRIGTSRGGRGG